jgi:hypothetical protein
MDTKSKRQGLQRLLKYLLLPITVLSVAILLSRCGQAPTSAPTYKGASLVGQAIISYDKASNNLAVQNFNAPNVTPPQGGSGFTVSLQQTGIPTFNGTQVTGALYIANASSNPALTGVVLVIDSKVSGSVTVANPDYGSGFRADAPSGGPWTWWFYAGTFPNYNIPPGGTSSTKTVTFAATASFAVRAYIYAFCPSGVVEDRLNNVAVPNAFVMLGQYPGDSNYIAEPNQDSNAVNYLTATDSNGYFALPITTVVGNYITYTTGAVGNGTDATNAQFDTSTLYATGFSNVVLAVRARVLHTSYVAVGDSSGNSSSLSPLIPGACATTTLPMALATQAIGYEDIANINISTLTGYYFDKQVIAGTGCGASDATIWTGMPSNLLLPAMNAASMSLYTSAGSSTSLYPRTQGALGNGKEFFVAAPANTSNFAFSGGNGWIPSADFLIPGSALASWDAPMPLTNVLGYLQFAQIGIDRGITTTTAAGGANGFSDTSSGTNWSSSPVLPITVTLSNLSTIFSPVPSQSYDVVGSVGINLANNPAEFEIVIPALSIKNTSVATMTISEPTTIPADGTLIPTAMVMAVDALQTGVNTMYTPNTGTTPLSDFSATVLTSDRTGYTPATWPASITFSQWYKLIALNWPTINSTDQTASWTSAANAGSGIPDPSLGYMLITYPLVAVVQTSSTFTSDQSYAALITRPQYAWEILFNPTITQLTIPTLPVTSPGILLTQGTYNRFYTVNILQGLVHMSVNGPAYTWDSSNNAVTIANYQINTMDKYSRIGFPVGGGWIITPSTGANLGAVGSTSATAYIDAYNWNIVSGGNGTPANPANLRGCFWANSTWATSGTGKPVHHIYNSSNCTTGTTACSSLPGVTVVAGQYAYQTATVSLSTGVYNTITFTPYNTTAGVSSGGSPACEQVGQSFEINVKN